MHYFMQKCVGGKLLRAFVTLKDHKLFPVRHYFHFSCRIHNKASSKIWGAEHRYIFVCFPFSLPSTQLPNCITFDFCLLFITKAHLCSLLNFGCLFWTSRFPEISSFLDVSYWCVVLPRYVRCNRSPVIRNVREGRTVSPDKTTRPKSVLSFVHNAIIVYSVMVWYNKMNPSFVPKSYN
jgi:hypothetical protein